MSVINLLHVLSIWEIIKQLPAVEYEVYQDLIMHIEFNHKYI